MALYTSVKTALRGRFPIPISIGGHTALLHLPSDNIPLRAAPAWETWKKARAAAEGLPEAIAAIQNDRDLSAEGRRNRLAKVFAETPLPRLMATLSEQISEARRHLEAEGNRIHAIDKTDLVGAMLRREWRDTIRGWDSRQVSRALAKGLDNAAMLAVLEAPGLLPNVTAEQVARIRAKALPQSLADEAEFLDAFLQGTDSLARAVEKLARDNGIIDPLGRQAADFRNQWADILDMTRRVGTFDWLSQDETEEAVEAATRAAGGAGSEGFSQKMLDSIAARKRPRPGEPDVSKA